MRDSLVKVDPGGRNPKHTAQGRTMARQRHRGGSLRVEDVLAPMPLGTFIERHLGREALVLPDKDDRFSDVLSWDDLNRHLNQLRVVGTRVRMYRNGARVDP